jgi:hypothetical protein
MIGCCCRRSSRWSRFIKWLTTNTVELTDRKGQPLRFRTLYVTPKLWFRAVQWVWYLPRRMFYAMFPPHVPQFDKFVFPRIDRVTATLVTQDILGVQPMQGPE